jgi:hypothetical protein
MEIYAGKLRVKVFICTAEDLQKEITEWLVNNTTTIISTETVIAGMFRVIHIIYFKPL